MMGGIEVTVSILNEPDSQVMIKIILRSIDSGNLDAQPTPF